MTTAAVILAMFAGALVISVIANIVFSFIAERKNPPIGSFIEYDGVRLHYLERGNPAARCVVLFHGNGTTIQDFTISGLVDHLASRSRVTGRASDTAKGPRADLDGNVAGGAVCEGP